MAGLIGAGGGTGSGTSLGTRASVGPGSGTRASGRNPVAERRRRPRARLLAAGAILAVAGAGAPADAAASNTTCWLESTATLSPGLTLMDGPQTLRVSGTVSDCSGIPEPTPATGTISVGNVWTDPGTGWRWLEPVGEGRGFCGNTSFEATSITRFEDGTVTVLRYQSQSVLTGVALTGFVIDEVALTAFDLQDGQPETLTVETTRNRGGIVAAGIASSVVEGNCVMSPVTEVNLDGVTTTTTASVGY